jgi:hypothetical protein
VARANKPTASELGDASIVNTANLPKSVEAPVRAGGVKIKGANATLGHPELDVKTPPLDNSSHTGPHTEIKMGSYTPFGQVRPDGKVEDGVVGEGSDTEKDGFELEDVQKIATESSKMLRDAPAAPTEGLEDDVESVDQDQSSKVDAKKAREMREKLAEEDKKTGEEEATKAAKNLAKSIQYQGEVRQANAGSLTKQAKLVEQVFEKEAEGDSAKIKNDGENTKASLALAEKKRMLFEAAENEAHAADESRKAKRLEGAIKHLTQLTGMATDREAVAESEDAKDAKRSFDAINEPAKPAAAASAAAKGGTATGADVRFSELPPAKEQDTYDARVAARARAREAGLHHLLPHRSRPSTEALDQRERFPRFARARLGSGLVPATRAAQPHPRERRPQLEARSSAEHRAQDNAQDNPYANLVPTLDGELAEEAEDASSQKGEHPQGEAQLRARAFNPASAYAHVLD